jgi:flagellar biosynthesis anti-sigma factor FlgM
MDIRNNLQALQQIFGQASIERNRAASSEGAAGSSAGPVNLDADQTTVSSAALHASQASALPDVRMNLVSSVQAAIASGNYHVDSAAVASKLISHMLGD